MNHDPVTIAVSFMAMGFMCASTLLMPCVIWLLADLRGCRRALGECHQFVRELARRNEEISKENEGLFHLITDDDDGEAWKDA
jgi:hypothetical protein